MISLLQGGDIMYDQTYCECTLPAYERYILNSPYQCCQINGANNYWGSFSSSIRGYVQSGGSQAKAMYELKMYGR